MSAKDGGPAFPSPLEWRETENAEGRTGVFDNAHDGMTLRDYFAARALTGAVHLAALSFGQDESEPDDDGIARYAYRLADAMLAERDRKP